MLPGWLKKHFPCLSIDESKQLSKDIIDKLGWSDLDKARGVTKNFDKLIDPTKSNEEKKRWLPTVETLKPEQVKILTEFLRDLPKSDQPAVDKILPMLGPPPASPSPPKSSGGFPS